MGGRRSGVLAVVVAPSVSVDVHAVLEGLLDNANVFPPGSAPLESALALHRSIETGPYAWLRGRMLLPSAALAELTSTLDVVWPDAQLQLGVIGDGPLDVVLDRVASFADARVQLDQIEVRVSDSVQQTIASVDAVRPQMPAVSCIAVEVAVIGRGAAEVARDLVALAGARADGRDWLVAKVRCGGVQPGMVPAPGELASFVAAAGHHRLPFKATAGLHHPFAAGVPSEAATGGWRHGFVNILAASARALDGASAGVVHDRLALTDPNELADLAIDAALVRTSGFIGMGTCSIVEPVADLRAAGWLP
jgi:hypothetical protein